MAQVEESYGRMQVNGPVRQKDTGNRDSGKQKSKVAKGYEGDP